MWRQARGEWKATDSGGSGSAGRERRLALSQLRYAHPRHERLVRRGHGRGSGRQLGPAALSLHDEDRAGLALRPLRRTLRPGGGAAGNRLVRRGVVVMVAGLALYGLLYASLRGAGGLVQALLAAPALAGTLLLLAGLGLDIASRALRRGAARFLTSPNLDKMAAPPTREAHVAPVVQPVSDEPRLAPEERRARRAQRRRRRRLIAVGAVVGGLVVLAAGVGGIALLISGESGLGHSGTQAYSASLSGSADGWANDDVCGFRQGAYHVAPLPTKFAVTCIAPAGAYRDFDASVTAAVASGTPEQPYGLAFRTVDLGNGYVFEITDGGTAQAVVIKNSVVGPPLEVWAFPAGVSRVPGARHTLTVRAHGSTITCLIDGAQAGTLSDATFARGALGVHAGAPGMDVVFSDFSVEPK